MALSKTQYGYIIDPMVPFTDDKGKTIKNGFVRVFVAGSSTPVITYRNFDGVANQDLIELDNSGRTKTSVIGSKGLTYKVCVYDAFHSQESPILTVDKVSVIGANITAGAGSTVVTGLDGLTTKPNGFVDASVVGTDGYVALDHTLVTDDLNTDAKVTAVEDDRYIPLLNNDVNDPDSKMTLGRLWQWVLGKINSLSTTITAFRTGDVIPVDGPSGTAKMAKDDLLREAAENTLSSINSEIEETADESDEVEFVDDLGNLIIGIDQDGIDVGGCGKIAKDSNYADDDAVEFVDDSNNLILGIDKDGIDVGGCGKIAKDSNYADDDAVVIESNDGKKIVEINNEAVDVEKPLYLSGEKAAEFDKDNYADDDEVELYNDKNNPYVKFGEYGAKVKGLFSIEGETLIRRITVSSSGAMFTSLTEAVLEAVKVYGTEVIVRNGTYDIIQEFESLYGADFFTNYNEDSGGNVGIKLYNGVKLFFDSRAFVICNYTGNNSKVMDVFSPFNANPMASNNDFEIHGLKIRASNVRYAVHDEMWSNATPYTHRYVDCDMYVDNTGSLPKPEEPTFRFTVCIGGGLGKYGKILLEGCKFETEEYTGGSTGPGVSWHNSSAANAKSVLDVNGCYFAGGSTFKFTWYGTSEEMSIAYVRGCRIGCPLINQAENGSATTVNASIVAWNNEEQ